MARFHRRIGILLLAGGLVNACALEDRTLGGAEPPADGMPEDGDPSGDMGEQPPGPDGQDAPPDNPGEPGDLDQPGGGGDIMPDGNGLGTDDGLGNTQGTGGTGAGAEPPPGAGGTGTVTEGEPPPPEVVPAAVDRFFGDWPAGTDPLTIGRRAAEIFTSQSLATGSGHSDTDGYKHYKDACAWYGALSVAELAGEQSLINALVAKYQPYEGTWGDFNPPTRQNAFQGIIDDSTFGIVPLEIAKFSANPVYVQEGQLAADHQITFLAEQLRNASDDMFHIQALQMQAYRVSTDAADRQRHMDTAADAMVSYLAAMQKNDGLIPHHLNQPGFDISWSRGDGWFAAGLAELMRDLPSTHPDYQTISAGYRRMMNGLLQYQIPAGRPGAGLWNRVVDSQDPRNSVETSGSAMFAYAFISGVREGLLDVDTFGPAARSAWLGLVSQLNAAGLIQNVADFVYLPSSHGYPADMYAGDEENYYFERPNLTGDNHGQAPLMWSAAALLRPLN